MQKVIVLYMTLADGTTEIKEVVGIRSSWMIHSYSKKSDAYLLELVADNEDVTFGATIPKKHVRAIVDFMTDDKATKLELIL